MKHYVLVYLRAIDDQALSVYATERQVLDTLAELIVTQDPDAERDTDFAWTAKNAPALPDTLITFLPAQGFGLCTVSENGLHYFRRYVQQ